MATKEVDDAVTKPSIPPEQKMQLQVASKTVKLNNPLTEIETKPLVTGPLLQGHTTLIFTLTGTAISFPMRIRITGRLVIGRQGLDTNTSEKVDLDLTHYGAIDAGVSRVHAVLYRTRYTISLADLGSTNGTYINGVKQVPHQPRLLREGDEVRFANLRFHLSFDR
jgi:pSer/pThr/pTyr-binding forkhead associated (FHA) protein